MRNSSKQQVKTGRHASVRKKNRRVPSLRLHKASGQAYVVLNGKAVYCGKHGTPEAEQQYHKVIAECLAADGQLPVEPDTITIKEILSRFWVHAAQYYRTVTDGRVKELEQFRLPCPTDRSGARRTRMNGLRPFSFVVPWVSRVLGGEYACEHEELLRRELRSACACLAGYNPVMPRHGPARWWARATVCGAHGAP